MSRTIQQTQALLEQELERLNHEVAELEQQDPANSSFRDVDNTDDDDAAESESHSRVQALLDATREKLDLVIRALAKVKEGTYGICDHTKKPINPDRLEIMPWAIYTREAEEELEAHQR